MNKLRHYRKKQGLTLIKVARIIGIAECSVSQHENGKRTPSIAILKKYAQLYKCSIDELLED